MKHDGHVFQNGVVVQLLHIFPANQHLALLHIIEPGDQFNDGALAGAGLPHQGHTLAVPDLQVDALQHIGLAVVRKPHIPQLNVVVLWEVAPTLIDRNVQNLFCLGNGAQHIGKVRPQFLQGPNLRQVQGTHIEEQQKGAGRQGASQEKHPAQGHHQQHAALDDDHKGRIRRSHPPGSFIPHGVFLVDGSRKLLEGLAPHVVGLDQFHAVDVLDHDGVQGADGAVGPVHQVIRVAEHDPHHSDGQDQGYQRGQRQRHIDGHQVEEDHHRPHQIAHQIRQVVGQEQFQFLNVLVQHRLDVPGAALIQSPQGRPGHVLRHHAAHLEQRPVGTLVGRHPGAAKQNKTQGHGHSDHRRDPYHQFGGTGPAEGGIHQLIDPHIGYNNAQPSGR